MQDTTELNYSAHPKTELLGPICDKAGVIGMLVHDTMAYTAQGTALGLIDVQCWTRDPERLRKAEQRYELPIEQKESYKWLASRKAAVRLHEQCPESTVISVGTGRPMSTSCWWKPGRSPKPSFWCEPIKGGACKKKRTPKD